MKKNTIVMVASILTIGYVIYIAYNKIKKKKEEEAEAESKMQELKQVSSALSNPKLKFRF